MQIGHDFDAPNTGIDGMGRKIGGQISKDTYVGGEQWDIKW